MREPEHPVGPAFYYASDGETAWRKQQEAALTAQQKEAYRRLQQDLEKKRREQAAQFVRQRDDLVDAEKRRLMERKPDLALRMIPGRRMKEEYARYLASGTIHARHEQERKTTESDHRQELDNFLYAAQRERQQQALSQEKERDKQLEKEQSDRKLEDALRDRVARKQEQRDQGREKDRRRGDERER